MTTPNASKDEKKLDYLHIAGGNVKWHRHYEKEMELSLKTKLETKTCPRNCTCGHLPQRNKSTCSHKTLYISPNYQQFHSNTSILSLA